MIRITKYINSSNTDSVTIFNPSIRLLIVKEAEEMGDAKYCKHKDPNKAYVLYSPFISKTRVYAKDEVFLLNDVPCFIENNKVMVYPKVCIYFKDDTKPIYIYTKNSSEAYSLYKEICRKYTDNPICLRL